MATGAGNPAVGAFDRAAPARPANHAGMPAASSIDMFSSTNGEKTNGVVVRYAEIRMLGARDNKRAAAWRASSRRPNFQRQ